MLLLFAGPLDRAHGMPATAATALAPPESLTYPPLAFEVPRAERFQLRNGITVYYLRDTEVPLVNLQIYVKAGSLRDPEGREGLADLTAAVMRTGGIRGMTGRQVDERLEFLAARAELAAGPETITGGLSVLRKDLEEGLAIFSGILRHPVFEEERLRLARDLRKEDLRRIGDDPQRFAFREFTRFFYRETAWGRLPSLESVGAIVRRDLVRCHERFFHPRNLWIAVSGDLSRQEAEEALERHFGSWPQEEAKPEADIPSPRANPRGIRLFSRPLSQSVVIVGHPAPSKSAPDFYAFEVLDFLLGSGGFSSRIFQTVRTDRGLAYSTGSFYRGRMNHGLFGAYALTRADATIQVLQLLEDILAATSRTDFPATDLRSAKDSLINGFIFSFQSTEQVVANRLKVEFDGLPSDYLETYREKIGRVTAADLRAVSRRWLDAGRAGVLVLGDSVRFGGSLDSFGRVTADVPGADAR